VSLFERVLGYGDDALIAAQRLGEWCSRAPEMEEDVALANIALDQLGTARLLLTYAGELEGLGRDEDDLAYLRGDRDFRNLLLVELDNGDFAVTMGKLLFLSTYQKLLYDRLAEAPTQDGAPASSDGGPASSGGADSDGVVRLAEIAAKARKESAYHLDHSSLWTIRLGDGTAESHRRMQDAVDALWPYTAEMFDTEPDLRPDWLATVQDVLARATLKPPGDGWTPRGGRDGVHTEGLSILLAEMQVLHRAYPGARW
jgi:ring-1,2-phenylacetyl-CoA epoxidase subunit PaaC